MNTIVRHSRRTACIAVLLGLAAAAMTPLAAAADAGVQTEPPVMTTVVDDTGAFSVDVPADGVYGEQEWKTMRWEKVPDGPNKGKPALDAYACKLIRLDWAAQNVPDEADFRAKLTAYCLAAEKNEPNWHYVQYRPVPVDIDPANPPRSGGDCSSSIVWAFKYAKNKTGYDVPCPAKQSFTGYGNTDYYEDDHVTVTGTYKVGDLGHYYGHVVMCIKPGDWSGSDWWSFGSEPPRRVKLNYRRDFRKVVRPPLIGTQRRVSVSKLHRKLLNPVRKKRANEPTDPKGG